MQNKIMIILFLFSSLVTKFCFVINHCCSLSFEVTVVNGVAVVNGVSVFLGIFPNFFVNV